MESDKIFPVSKISLHPFRYVQFLKENMKHMKLLFNTFLKIIALSFLSINRSIMQGYWNHKRQSESKTATNNEQKSIQRIKDSIMKFCNSTLLIYVNDR